MAATPRRCRWSCRAACSRSHGHPQSMPAVAGFFDCGPHSKGPCKHQKLLHDQTRSYLWSLMQVYFTFSPGIPHGRESCWLHNREQIWQESLECVGLRWEEEYAHGCQHGNFLHKAARTSFNVSSSVCTTQALICLCTCHLARKGGRSELTKNVLHFILGLWDHKEAWRSMYHISNAHYIVIHYRLNIICYVRLSRQI